MTRAFARLRDERGYSLIEMLTVMTILSVILGSLTTVFVQATHAELDMNERFQAQQSARLALDKIRREIHCAKEGETPSTTGQATTVTLKLQAQCPTAVNGAETLVSWCTVLMSTGRYALYRKVGSSCDSGGVKWADYVSSAAVFDYQTQSVNELSRVRVSFPIDVDTQDSSAAYALCDIIVLRNSTRSAPTSTQLGFSDTAAPAVCV